MSYAYDRFYGAILGLAYGDAIGFPALFHRFVRLPQRRHDFLWRTNREMDHQHVLRLMLPFTHRIPGETLEPAPTDDTEFAVLTLEALLSAPDKPHRDHLVTAWLERVLPVAGEVYSGFSERSAIENFKRGLLPPATGNDNPLHYADAAVPRAVPIGLYHAGDPDSADHLARLDAEITQAEDGVYAAQAMAAAVAVLGAGGALDEALGEGRARLPEGTWIAHGDDLAQDCVEESGRPEELPLLLQRRLINTVYSYGNVAPETLPAAFALVEACEGDFHRATLLANTVAKAADSLPAMVGALCGAYQGARRVGPAWEAQLVECRGVCLPFLAGARLDDLARRLHERVTANGGAA
jgi:ADP-ribosylglycohydrolase